jgi:hypothetical protein
MRRGTGRGSEGLVAIFKKAQRVLSRWNFGEGQAVGSITTKGEDLIDALFGATGALGRWEMA